MKKFAFALLIVLIAGCPAPAQVPAVVPLDLKGDIKVVKVDKVITVQEDLTVVGAVPFTVVAPAGAASYSWDVPAGVVGKKRANTFVVSAAPSGRITIGVDMLTVDFDAKKMVTTTGEVSFSFGGVVPIPPVPPTPPPTPSIDPIGAGGFAVLISFDSSITIRPPGELSVIYGKAVRTYLESKCIADPTSPKQKAYRIYPANTAGAPKLWDDAFNRKGGADWILIGTGSAGYSGPLPKTEAEALELLKKYGG